MVSVEEAESIILGHLFTPKIISIEIERAAGHVLAEPVYADRDFPPFNRVTMDGIAIRYQSFQNGQRIFQLEGIQAAGMAPQKLRQENNAMEVMTGAMLPVGIETISGRNCFAGIHRKKSCTCFSVSKNCHRQHRR
jgi:molybdopterin molybdotransferase